VRRGSALVTGAAWGTRELHHALGGDKRQKDGKDFCYSSLVDHGAAGQTRNGRGQITHACA
jgi:hypothetical protein